MAQVDLFYAKAEEVKETDALEFGTVKELLGARGSLGISPRSLRKGNTKRINVAFKSADGSIRKINCSMPLSDIMRDAIAEGKGLDDIKAALLPLEVKQWDDGFTYIVLPAGAGTIFTDVKALVKIDTELDYADIATQSQLI